MSGPGKFEGEPEWVESLWNLSLEGGADEELEVDGVLYFIFTIARRSRRGGALRARGRLRVSRRCSARARGGAVVKEWIVERAECITWMGGLRVEGVNLNFPESSPDRRFGWRIPRESIADRRYDWSKCKFAPGAAERAFDAGAAMNEEG